MGQAALQAGCGSIGKLALCPREDSQLWKPSSVFTDVTPQGEQTPADDSPPGAGSCLGQGWVRHALGFPWLGGSQEILFPLFVVRSVNEENLAREKGASVHSHFVAFPALTSGGRGACGTERQCAGWVWAGARREGVPSEAHLSVDSGDCSLSFRLREKHACLGAPTHFSNLGSSSTLFPLLGIALAVSVCTGQSCVCTHTVQEPLWNFPLQT